MTPTPLQIQQAVTYIRTATCAEGCERIRELIEMARGISALPPQDAPEPTDGADGREEASGDSSGLMGYPVARASKLKSE